MKKRILAMVLCLALCVSALGLSAMANGITWSYDEATATLTVAGTGPMGDYQLRNDHYAMTTAPWTEHYRTAKAVVVKPGVTTISAFAFANFEALESVTIPDSVTEVGDRAFASCRKLKSIVLPSSVQTMGSMVFYHCTALESVVLPDELMSLQRGTFQYCIGLKGITLPSELLELKASSLQECKNLAELKLPKTLRSVGQAALEDCNSLTELVFHENFKHIGSFGIAKCDNLKTVWLPASLTGIDDNAFKESNALTDVYYAGTEAQWKALNVPQTGNEPLFAAKMHFNAAPAPAVTDVADSAWYSDPVSAAAKAGIIAGNADGSFNPDGVLSWAHAITFAVRLDQYCKGQKVYSAADQTGSKWYDIYLHYALANKSLTAEPANMTASITRGEAAVVFAAVMGQKQQVNDVAEGYFSDVPASGALHDAVYALARAGICNGTGNGTFGVNNTFKRCEVAAIVARMAGLVAPAVIAK